MKKGDIGLMAKKVGKQGVGSHGYQSYITASSSSTYVQCVITGSKYDWYPCMRTHTLFPDFFSPSNLYHPFCTCEITRMSFAFGPVTLCNSHTSIPLGHGMIYNNFGVAHARVFSSSLFFLQFYCS